MFAHPRRLVLHLLDMAFAVIAHQRTETNLELAARGWRGEPARIVTPREALLSLSAGDVALNRLDVSPDFDGVEEGIWSVTQLETQGVRVLNRAPALLAAHDKLLTGRLLAAAGVVHPKTRRLESARSADGLAYPVVAKPRFGSWGRDVELCSNRDVLARYVARMASRPWWSAGAVVQELVALADSDLRVIVAGGHIVGAARRIPAAGEWRTNVALGGTSTAAVPPPKACELAERAARALGVDFCGVDFLPSNDGWVVLEVNGAVDIKPHYALGDVYAAAVQALQRLAEELLLASGGERRRA
jgi:RimK family alpha-L-glutamate ligase